MRGPSSREIAARKYYRILDGLESSPFLERPMAVRTKVTSPYAKSAYRASDFNIFLLKPGSTAELSA